MRRVLVLGAGLVSRPLVRFFLEQEDCRTTVATLIPEHGASLVADHPSGSSTGLDVEDAAALEAAIAAHDLVVSLVPYAFHPAVARRAIAARVPMVTASYVSPEMQALDADARAAGVPILNELGLDPGLDHVSAMQLLARIRAEGGAIRSFVSGCGSLPAPEAADNPWRYKFAWSPRGVFLASGRPARYREDGEEIEVSGSAVFAAPRPWPIEGVADLEAYPNRDSLPYLDKYGLEGVHTMLRATLRYPGWCDTLRGLIDYGLLDETPRTWPDGTTYAHLVPPPEDARLRERLEWAGLCDPEALPRKTISPLDALVARLEPRMRFEAGERDLVVLEHRVEADHGGERRRWRSRLVAFGDPGGDSATARTVSLPAAIGGRLLLDGTIRTPGVLIPTAAGVFGPVLERLADVGIRFETTFDLAPRAT